MFIDSGDRAASRGQQLNNTKIEVEIYSNCRVIKSVSLYPPAVTSEAMIQTSDEVM